MSEQAQGLYDLTEPVVSAHPNLAKPKAFVNKKTGKANGDPKYSLNLVFNPDSADLKGLKEQAATVAKTQWPTRQLKDLVFPFKSGDKVADKAVAEGRSEEQVAFLRGKVVMSARSKYPPAMAAMVNGKAVDIDASNAAAIQQNFYFGVEVLAQVRFNAYEGVGANPDGVNAYLQQVLSTNKGKRLGGVRSAASTFSGYAGRVTQENPMGETWDNGTTDEEIPF